MKQGVAILVLLSVLMPGLIKTYIYVDFKINQKRIAKTLCINKDKPITICGGSCYLARELNKTTTPAPAPIPEVLKIKAEINFFIDEGYDVPAHVLHCLMVPQGSAEQSLHSLLVISDIFHPPRIA